ncbi:MAG: hypothetical protein PHI63_03260 [Patescibacteria group bacterium]|nr:hypothetical protein [Patescibacteria group bacterium]
MENTPILVAPEVDPAQLEKFLRAVRALNEARDVDQAFYEQVKRTVAAALALIDPFAPYGKELYEAIALRSVSVAVELVCLRRDPANGKLQVLLLRRGPLEAFPNQYHCGGSITRVGELPPDVFRRLVEKEYGCPLNGEPVFVTVIRPPREILTREKLAENRGHCQSEVWLARISGSSRGEWFDVDNLPADTNWAHRGLIIPAAAEHFEKVERIVGSL